MAEIIFRFREFDLQQNAEVFPLGTDTMLLGAWVQPLEARSILDVGTGTGALALMMAQKTTVNIAAIDVSEKAAELARLNVKQSKWPSQIAVSQISLQEFAKTNHNHFDLIISNPPYFRNSLKPQKLHRATARHDDRLPLCDLLHFSLLLLSAKGRICLVLPTTEAVHFIGLAEVSPLHLLKKALVKPTTSHPPNRMLLEFSKDPQAVAEEMIVIREGNPAHYTGQYIEMTKAFHFPGALGPAE
ncbi:MAG: methyltransferase [Bacteroidia bacterium]